MRLSYESRELLRLQDIKLTSDVFERYGQELYKLRQHAPRSGPAQAAIDRLYVRMADEIVQAAARGYLEAFRRERLVPTDEEIQEITRELVKVAHSIWYSDDHQPFWQAPNDFESVVPRAHLSVVVAVKVMRLDQVGGGADPAGATALAIPGEDRAGSAIRSAVGANVIEWDVFISHASEDKAAVARPLADILAASGIRVWLDEAELNLGDSLREKIDDGLSRSQFGVVVLSPNFFGKQWPKSELDGLIAREKPDTKVILPVWHDLSVEKVRNYSPILAGRLAVSTAQGLQHVAKKISQAIRAIGRARPTARPLYAGKLTKKILFSLPFGSVLITNTVKPDLTPQFVEELGNADAREELWNRLRIEHADGKIYVFEDMAHMRSHLEARHDWLPDELRA
jgi:TIR domain